MAKMEAEGVVYTPADKLAEVEVETVVDTLAGLRR